MTRYAFLIGCDEYSNFSNIDFCQADMLLIQETLVQYCDYEYKNIKTNFQYRGCGDSPEVIYGILQNIIDNAEEGDSILFYFAGHGAKEGEKGYLLLADSKVSDFQNTALDLAKINELLRNPRIDGFLVLDACHSGILARNAFDFLTFDKILDTGCVTLAACSENEESHPYQEKEQGVFTYYFCEEIKKTVVDSPVYIENLKLEVCNSVTEWAKSNYKRQTPTLIGQIVGNKAIAVRNQKNYESNVEYKYTTTKIQEKISSTLDNEELLYRMVLNKWLNSNCDMRISCTISRNSEWKIFGKYYIFLAYDKGDTPWLIMLNILNKYNYSNVLHAFKNLLEIKNYYSRFGKKYEYHQIIVISKSRAKELETMINSHTKIKKMYNDGKIKNTILYLEGGEFNYISCNYKT